MKKTLVTIFSRVIAGNLVEGCNSKEANIEVTNVSPYSNNAYKKSCTFGTINLSI